MQLFYAPGLPNENFLSKEESLHCVKVLRHKEGDIIDLIDGKGTFYKAKIIEANHKKCVIQPFESEVEKTFDHYRHIAIAPTKNMDRLEWFAEKAVELGIDEISFFYLSSFRAQASKAGTN
jgi:16S rRNA (uracil1498-N3)-methyltransferase